MQLEGSHPMEEMNELLCKLLWGQLQSMGMFTEEPNSIVDLKGRIGVLLNVFEPWLKESFNILVQHNYLQLEGVSYVAVNPNQVNVDGLWMEWDRQKGAWLEEPDIKGHVAPAEAMLKELPQVLIGERNATDVLFPNSSLKMVEGIYKGNLVAEYFHEVLADTLVLYIQERMKQDASMRIRILEIGAGHGGASTTVFEKLKPYRDHIQEYGYTDISEGFLTHAKKEYGSHYSYLNYFLFNVEDSLTEQCLAADEYDIIIASNVLYATRNIRQTLRNAKQALKKHGLILLNEITGKSLFTHLTLGLLERWWAYEDPELRIPGCPGLTSESWKLVLENEGFCSVFFPAHEAHSYGQQIIIAESDGVVREIRQKTSTATKPSRSIGHTTFTGGEQPGLSAVQKVPAAPQQGKITDFMLEKRIQETIMDILSESLKVDAEMIEMDKSFADYGLDSITGVHVVQLLNQSLKIELEATRLFDYASVHQLTTYLISQYEDVIVRALYPTIESKVDNQERLDSRVKPSNSVEVGRFPSRRDWQGTDKGGKTKSTENPIQKDAIAIIGMSGRFAKSDTLNELWEHLSKGTDLIEEVTRWDLSEYLSGSFCNHGSYLDDIDKFDPLFFNISEFEATYMDPQQRFFLEESWKALEDAGYAGKGIQGRSCGVYVGYNGGDYERLFGDNPPPQAMWGNAASVIPARISYYLNLRGPAITIDTACSSSLVAIHLACQGLWTGETEMALAGGVFIQSTPGFHIAANRAGMLSPNGHCYTFDQRADGFVPGEGVSVVVLKRLQEAVADGDHIYGVIRGSGINQDGTTNGITAPSANSQESLACQVYDAFHIDPVQIQMVEAHGTGTSLGDPIEYQAITRAFRKYTDQNEYCAIGSIKTNIGHTTAAAGVAGLNKVLLSLQHKQIPPSLHYQSGNPNIQFKNSPFYVSTELKDWDIEQGKTRYAAINSFGFSGTNAHMVIEEAPSVQRQHTEKPGYLIVLSARTAEQLRQQAVQMIAFCKRTPETDCGNMSYTLLIGRKHGNHRLACIVQYASELAELLEKWLDKGRASQIYVAELNDNEHREQSSLKRFGNQCISNCQSVNLVKDYLDDLSAVAELYIQGYELEFEQLFSNDLYARLSLPTYPFAKERYWVTEREAEDGIQEVTLPIHSAKHTGGSETGDVKVDHSERTIQANLLKIVSSIARIPEEQIDVNQDFFAYGFDSISAMSLIYRVKDYYGMDISTSVFLSYNCVQQLTQYILSEKSIAADSGLEDGNSSSTSSESMPIPLEGNGAVASKQLDQAESYPLSINQTGLWLIHQLAPDSYAYNLPHVFRLKQKVDTDALRAALQYIVLRHGLLRARMVIEDQEPIHVIEPADHFYFETERVDHILEADLTDYLLAKIQQPFDLEKGFLMRSYLFSVSEEDHILVFTIHHTVFDGSSLMILLRELLHAYAMEAAGERAAFPISDISYADFVKWQRELLVSKEGLKQKEYWLQVLSGELPVLNLPADRHRSEALAFKGETFTKEISHALTDQVQKLSAEEKISPFIFMLSAFKTLLYRYTEQEDILVGTALHGRPGKQFEDVIGYFVNMVLIRTTVFGNQSFRKLLKAVQTNTFGALQHGDYPFSEVVKEKKGNRNRGNSPLIQVAFVFQNWFKPSDLLVGWGENVDAQKMLMLEPLHNIHQEGEFDISLEVYKIEERYKLFFKYNPDLFDKETISRMSDHYIELIRSLTANSDQTISEIDYLTAQEKNHILTVYNDTEADYPKEKCVHQLFKEQVKNNPNHIAVMCEEKTLTYKELHKKSNQLARLLKKRGVKRNSIVGIIAGRSLEMMVGLFGILKAGSAYLPIDSDYPLDRIHYMLKDSGAGTLLIQGELQSGIAFDGQIVSLIDSEIGRMNDADLQLTYKPADLAYVIYTSGSTGEPKGVMIEHHSLVNRLKWMQKAYPLRQEDIILQKTPYTFDVSVWELFWWAMEGATVCLLPPKAEKDPHRIAETIERDKVTVMHFVPSMLTIFLDYIKGFSSINKLSSLKQIFASGEALTAAQVKLYNEMLFHTNGTKLMNLYGPTEATIDVSYFDCSTGEEIRKVPIGKPIDNIRLYIVNPNNQLQPVGLPGELCIAGVGLARGYLNNEELTNSKFVDNPFDPSTKMYRTGDVAKWLPDGHIEYLGRKDRQVKIRGVRMELGEIEAVLADYEHIKEVCVTIAKDKDLSGNSRLLVHMSAKEQQTLSVEDIKKHLKLKLPDYMIPSSFVQLDALPVTAHGKVDIKALSSHVDKGAVRSVLKQEAELEITNIITSIYREVLQVDEINPTDNFFDLGGHSMLLVKAALKLKEVLRQEVTTVELFQYPTIESLALRLSRHDKVSFDKSKSKAMKQREILLKLNQATRV